MATENPITEMLRQLVEAGTSDVYPCPCRARGSFAEYEAGVFVITYSHDDDCPVLTGRSAA